MRVHCEVQPAKTVSDSAIYLVIISMLPKRIDPKISLHFLSFV